MRVGPLAVALVAGSLASGDAWGAEESDRQPAADPEDPRVFLGATGGAVLYSPFHYRNFFELLSGSTDPAFAGAIFALIRPVAGLRVGSNLWFYSNSEDVYEGASPALLPGVRAEYGIYFGPVELHALADFGGLFYLSSPGDFRGIEGGGGLGAAFPAWDHLEPRIDVRVSGYAVASAHDFIPPPTCTFCSDQDEELDGYRLVVTAGAHVPFWR